MPTFVIKCEIPFEYFAIVLNINACIIPVCFFHTAMKDSSIFCLTQLVMERPRGEQSLYSEFKQLPGRSRNFVLRVICEDLLYHETPVAMSSVVCMNIRRIVMRPHVQRMLHNLAVGHRSAFSDYHSLSVAQAGTHIPSVALLQSEDQRCVGKVILRFRIKASIEYRLPTFSARLRLLVSFFSFLSLCLFVFSYALLLSIFDPMWSRNLEPKANF